MEKIHELFLCGDSDKFVDPSTYEESIYEIDASKWQIIMESEMESMYSNQVWVLVDPPVGIVSVGCKWVFNKKISANG